MNDHIVILDFGSQYTQLIARKVRDLGVYAEVRASESVQFGVRGGWGPTVGPQLWGTAQVRSGEDTWYGGHALDVDGPSAGVLARELEALYAGVPLPEYVAWAALSALAFGGAG